MRGCFVMCPSVPGNAVYRDSLLPGKEKKYSGRQNCNPRFHIVQTNTKVGTMQAVPITTDVVSSNLDQGEVYNII